MPHTTAIQAICNNHVNIQYAMPPDIPSPSCLRLSVSQYPSQLPPTLCRKPQQSGCNIWSHCNSNTFTTDNTLGLFFIRALHTKMHCEWKGTWTNQYILGYRLNQTSAIQYPPLGTHSHPKGLHFLSSSIYTDQGKYCGPHYWAYLHIENLGDSTVGTQYLPTHKIYNQRSIVGYNNSVKLKIVCILKTSN